MRAKLIAIGNSRGVRLPKALLEQCNFGTDIELEVVDEGLLLRPRRKKPRQGWAGAFARMHAVGDDKLLDEKDAHSITPDDAEEWQW